MRSTLLLLILSLAAPAAAQFSGSSFGGSRGFGGGGSSSSSSSWGSSSSSSWDHDNDFDERNDERAERDRQRRAEEARRRAEEEERRRREEEERRRLEEERRLRQLAADRALPAEERARLSTRFESVDVPMGLALRYQDPRSFDPAEEAGERTETALEVHETPVYSAAVSPPSTPDWINGALCTGPTFLLFVILGLMWRGVRRGRVAALAAAKAMRGVGGPPSLAIGGPSKRGRGSCEVRRISIAFDWTERKRLQETLEAVGTRHDVQSERGMYGAAKEVAQILSSALGAARFAMWESRLAWPNDAEQRFFSMSSDLESRYRYDPARQKVPDRGPKAEEGEGFVVVSLVLGSTRRMPNLPPRLDASTLSEALIASLSVSSRELVAVKVVWSPAVDHDRMSSAELVEVYPELLPLHGAQTLGRVACSHCCAIYAGELPRCPACGAPR